MLLLFRRQDAESSQITTLVLTDAQEMFRGGSVYMGFPLFSVANDLRRASFDYFSLVGSRFCFVSGKRL
ncbi:hypothetical protein [Brunnivagina elsteri]|uniref:hypothetical protein n=1 Tax=Brunnivagina elsteri TaxID=1247191 RepID=UPI001177AF8B|nr:hypothetical protein [Calothrix elsteri]